MEHREEKTAELIAYLRSLGFEGEGLEKEITRNTRIGLPKFTVSHRIPFSGDLMEFDLRFSGSRTSGYQLESYRATCRSRMEIDHINHQGFDTAALEEHMARIDWQSYFLNPDGISDPGAVETIMWQMDSLYSSQDPTVIEIHQQLAFMYWPRDIYETLKHPQARHMEIDHVRSVEFPESEVRSGVNASLAYHIVSGGFDDLYYQLLEPVGLEDFTDVRLNDVLRRELSRNPDSFEVTCFRNNPDGLIEFRIPVLRTEEGYDADIIHATYTPHPEISHGVYNGIDTALLEEQMRSVDWHNERELFRYHDDESGPEILPPVGEIQEQLYHLGRDMAGGVIADQLQLKYWIDAPFFDGMIDQTAWDELEERPKTKQEFLIENTAPRITNLMRGRAVMDRPMREVPTGSGLWYKLDKKGPSYYKGMPPLKRIAGFTVDELEGHLKLLPIAKEALPDIRDALIDGEIVDFPLKDERTVLIEANPEGKTLNLYTPEMVPIPFNFRFDPDWKPSETTRPQLERPNTKRAWKRKGKGM